MDITKTRAQANFVSKSLSRLAEKKIKEKKSPHNEGNGRDFHKATNGILGIRCDEISAVEASFTHQIEKLRIENLTCKLKLETSNDEERKHHNDRSCKIRCKMAEKEYSQLKFTHVNKKLVDTKVEEAVISKTGPLMVATIIDESIPPSSSLNDCWEKLNKGMKSFQS